MRRQRWLEDYWDKYEDYNEDSSLYESDCDELSLDLLRFDDERKVMIKNAGRKEESMGEGLEDKRRVLLDDNKRILKLVWKKNAGGYL